MKKRAFYKLLSILFLFLGFLPLILNSVIYPNFLEIRFNINSTLLIISSLLIFIVFKTILKSNYKKIFIFSVLGFWIGILAFYIMYLLETTQYKNIVFSHIHIIPNQFVWIPIFLAAISILSLSKKIIKKYFKILIFFLPIAISAILMSIRLTHKNIYFSLAQEDLLIEWISVVSSLAISIFAGLILHSLKGSNYTNKYYASLLKIFCYIAIIGGIFVSGEEISWGQRIFNFYTPEKLEQVNIQNETTLHNIKGIYSIFDYFLLFAGIHGSISWIGLRFFKNLQSVSEKLIKTITLWVPPCYTSSWFWLAPVYIKIRFDYGPWVLPNLSEEAEMLLLTGFAITWVKNYLQTKNLQFN